VVVVVVVVVRCSRSSVVIETVAFVAVLLEAVTVVRETISLQRHTSSIRSNGGITTVKP
jgi:hypothetical protein